MKTVTGKDGNVYEIGKVYEFSDSGEADEWTAGQLAGLNEGGAFEFEANLAYFKYCRENQAENGTITKAPVELVDGGIYEFELNNSKCIGYFDKNRRSFFNSIAPKRNKICGAIEPKGITRLVPEVE